MDDGAIILKLQKKLLHVFLMLNNKSAHEYQRALTASIVIWSHLKDLQHPVWQMFASNASAFNEECGEICFSVLARGVAKNGARSDIKTIDRWFRLIRTKIQVAQELGIEVGGDDFKHLNRGRSTISKKSREVKATAAFFQRMIRTMKAGNYVHYDHRLGKPDQGGTIRPVVAATMLTPLDMKVGDLFKVVHSKLKGTMGTFWVYPHSDIWPAATPRTVSSSDDELVDPPQSRRRAQGRGHAQPNRQNEASGRRRKRPRSSQSSLLGRVIGIPAREMGDRWAVHIYGEVDSRRAVHFGRVDRLDENSIHVHGKFLFTDERFKATVSQAKAGLVPVARESHVCDGVQSSD